MENENLSQVYWDKLMSATNPASVLVSFYSSTFDVSFDPLLIPKFARLIKLYGRETVFNAIMICFGFIEDSPKDIFLLLNRVCFRIIEGKNVVSDYVDLTESIESMRKLQERLVKRKKEVKNPFDE